MRLKWDQFAKEVIPNALEGVGWAETAVELRADAQVADVVVGPKHEVDWAVAFHRLGWLTRMAEERSMIEAFSTTTTLNHVRECLRRQLTLFHHLRLKAKEN